ncbi:MAG: extracellular solute-binding protein [Treponema sp.]|jgi:raffinose/stachyose/melibiose transport system substrate-binding protein|nr:extracellular solute-binding protein [Treponema sp.]
MKKCLIVILAFTLAVSAFAGGRSQGGSQGGKERIRVVTFFAGSDQWAPVWKEVIQDYQNQNPAVEIVDESQPTSGQNDLFRTKIQTEIAAKNPPELLLFFNGADGSAVIDSGLYVDWTSYMKEDPAWAANLKAGPMEAGNLNGIQYCIPYIGYYEGLIYNKGLFDKYGLKEPTTWENILACIDTFKQNGIVPFATSMMKPSYLVEALILAQAGAEGQKKSFDDSWVPALDAVATLYARGAFPPDTLTMTEDEIRVLFADQKAAMMVNGSWTINGIKSNPNMRIIAMPALPGGAGGEKTTVAGFGSGWYMSKNAAQRSGETLKFLKWLTSPNVITRFIAVGGSSAIVCDAPVGATPVEISAVEMLNKAVNTRPAADSQVVREAWLAITEDGIPYLVEKQRTARQLLERARGIK